jgi:hypothetical protein
MGDQPEENGGLMLLRQVGLVFLNWILDFRFWIFDLGGAACMHVTSLKV